MAVTGVIYLGMGYVLYSFLKRPSSQRQPYTRAFKTKRTVVAGVRG